MKKNFRFAFIILLLLAILAIILVVRSRKGTMRQDSNEFAVNDTSNVTKIFLADKMNNTVKLEKVGQGEWKLNDNLSGSSDMVNSMLKTILLLDVKRPVARNARNNIIMQLAAKSVKVEIYQQVYRINIFDWIKLFQYEKRTKTYYVGDATQDNMGTYMLMEGSDDPYVVFIPGFRGFVATRFSPYETDWRGHEIFNCKLPDIKKVSLQYSDAPEHSFSIENNNNREFIVTSLANNMIVQDFDTIKVIQYLGSFYKVNFEAFLNNMDKHEYDSIVAIPPTVVISLEDKFGKQFVMKAWKRKAEAGEMDMEGNPVDWDRDRMFAQVQGTKELVAIQYFVFDRILLPLNWFIDKSTAGQ